MIITIPTLLSLLRIALVPVFILMFFLPGYWLIISIIIFSIAALTDAYDGYIARKYNLQSALGAFLDPLADKILILATFFCLVIRNVMSWKLVFIFIIRDLLVTYLRIKALSFGVELKTTYLAKCKTVGQFISIYVAFILLLIRQYTTNHKILFIFSELFFYIAILIGFITIYSAIAYLHHYVKLTKKKSL